MHHTAVHPTAHTYTTSNTPPLTTHLALNVFGTLRGQCPCDEYRDEKRSDWICHVCTPLLNVRANSPETVTRSYDCEETEAMDQCSRGIVLAMLGSYVRSSVVDGRAEALRWYTSEWRKSRRRLSSHAWWGFHSMGRWRYTGYLYERARTGEIIHNP